MNKIFQLLVFSGFALFFGGQVLKMLPVFVRLLGALLSRAVKWPGPIVHDPDERANWQLQSHGIFSTTGLFQAFMGSFIGVFAAFFFSVFSFLDGTSLLEEHIHVNWSCGFWFLSIGACVGGLIGARRTNYFMALVSELLANLAPGIEPRQVDGKTSESEYAIEHPLLYVRSKNPDFRNALVLFCEATRYYQDGEGQKAMVLMEKVLMIDPALHEHALESLESLAKDCAPRDAGPIYFWLAGHSEYLQKLGQAAEWYEKAADAFHQFDYRKRESRVRCNLGHVKMTMHDGRAGMAEFEKWNCLYQHRLNLLLDWRVWRKL